MITMATDSGAAAAETALRAEHDTLGRREEMEERAD